MDRAEIHRVLRDIASVELSWQGPLPDGELTDHLDSVELLTLVVAVEDRFGVSLDPDDEQQARTLDQLVATIERKIHGLHG